MPFRKRPRGKVRRERRDLGSSRERSRSDRESGIHVPRPRKRGRKPRIGHKARRGKQAIGARVLLCFVVSVVCCALCACAKPPPSPFFGDEKYLRFGVDPRDEADAVIKLYAERSEPLALRIVGHDFTALGFMNRSGVASRVRVVTAVGIALALDPAPSTPLAPETHYALLAAPIPETQDADGDGFEEVFVEARTEQEMCLSVYRVRDVGHVDLVPTRVSLLGKERCPSAVADLDGDGHAELIADIQLVDFEADRPPSVRVALWAERHRFVPRDETGRATRFIEQELRDRRAELERARGAGNAQMSMRIAIELSALHHVLERPTSEQLADFDAALAGVALTPDVQAYAAAARDYIEQGWTGTPPSPTTSPQLAESETSWYITPSHEQAGKKQVKQRSAHLSKSKGRAKFRRGGAHRSRPRAHGIRGQKSKSKARGYRRRVRGHRPHGAVPASHAHRSV